MISLESYFGRIFVINLAHRTDRLEHFTAEMTANGVPMSSIERFDAFYTPHMGIVGATKSHRAVIRRIAEGPHERGLIFEDDAEVLTRDKLKAGGFTESQEVWKTHCSVLNGYGTLQDRFNYLARFIPSKWDMLWLGGGYGDKPMARVNAHVIRFRQMKCCAAYAVSRDFARFWTAEMDRIFPGDTQGAVDDMFHAYADDHLFYVLQPRLIFTGMTRSDVNGQTNSYLFSMTDPVAVQQLDGDVP